MAMKPAPKKPSSSAKPGRVNIPVPPSKTLPAKPGRVVARPVAPGTRVPTKPGRVTTQPIKNPKAKAPATRGKRPLPPGSIGTKGPGGQRKVVKAKPGMSYIMSKPAAKKAAPRKGMK